MKRIGTILFLVLLSGRSLSQETRKWAVAGIRIGYCTSRLTRDFTDNDGNKHSFTFAGGLRYGGFIQIYAGKKIIFQPEILLTSKAIHEKTKVVNSNYTYSNKERVAYLELPLNILVKFPVKKGFFSAGGGPAPAFAINNYYYARLKKFDMGLNLAGGYQWPSDFSIQMNFTKGFSPVSKHFNSSSSQKNLSLGLTIGYTF